MLPIIIHSVLQRYRTNDGFSCVTSANSRIVHEQQDNPCSTVPWRMNPNNDNTA